MPPETLSLGCRLNAAEADAMAALAAAGGMRDALIVNTCAVTAEAEAQGRQAIRRAARAHPGRPIIVTGCAASLDPAAWAALPGVARVIPNAEKLSPASWGAPAGAIPPPVSSGRARAFLGVQQGCDHACTFCVIRIARGPARAVALEEAVAAARAAIAHGQREVVLTGVDLASWREGGRDLSHLVRALLALPGLLRVRLSSLDPAAVPPDLIRLWAEEEGLAPSLHLAAQHGDALMLKRMRRRHSPAQAIALAEAVRAARPDLALGLDLIAGFPTETAAQHAASIALIEVLRPAFLHVFPYSPRPGTPAARMPALPPALVRERAAALRAAGQPHALAAARARLGKLEQVLFDTPNEGVTAQGLRLRAADGERARGAVERLRVRAVEGAVLLGEGVG
ncbi:MAG: radical SAM protein [Rhodovarius sp.]|nr:radical SAM protein [Rhodovarius sp.]MDW8315998.1 radical SAM protein [Rhodovarius sp.]